MLRRLSLAAVIAVSSTGVALAQENGRERGRGGRDREERRHVPELDPAAVGAVAAVVIAGSVILARRRKR